MDENNESQQFVDQHGGHEGSESADQSLIYGDMGRPDDYAEDSDDEGDTDLTEEEYRLSLMSNVYGSIFMLFGGGGHIADASMEENYRGGCFGAAPASKEAIDALKVGQYKAEKGSRRAARDGAKTTACVVCQEELEEGVDVACMPCSHEFHADCLFPWLNRSRFCPICRFELPREKGWASG